MLPRRLSISEWSDIFIFKSRVLEILWDLSRYWNGPLALEKSRGSKSRSHQLQLKLTAQERSLRAVGKLSSSANKKPKKSRTVGSHYNTVQLNTIMHTTQQQRELYIYTKPGQSLYSKTPIYHPREWLIVCHNGILQIISMKTAC